MSGHSDGLDFSQSTPELPWTLENRQWVDFRVPDPDPLEQLIWGITGQRPSKQFHALPSNNPPLSLEAGDVEGLVPRTEKVTIEIRLAGKNIDEFSDEERDKFLAGLSNLLGLGKVLVTLATTGSIRLHLELKPEDADRCQPSLSTKA